ncbi:hypothetical protein BO70DRAFT_357412 [Aspergillus heteromorphus CBS 117.55]|uniref:VWFA domain-containing protein n=1 Tax=Aspergillus heteromorphus CBS 117.55 TaxID=1448321 RepID=A0A317X6T1_9EURO|nr:uncharacterized protein BO70DRAFT_357412 [Aspergillus heteromorphus CBS 117.55]PWY92280.1 hypothetical protein BO70DRAFT_357412 [Aspergillus heteromorphus CBS 117.55]
MTLTHLDIHNHGCPDQQVSGFADLWLVRWLKAADNIDDALTQYYENPNKYSHGLFPSEDSPQISTQETWTSAPLPPPSYHEVFSIQNNLPVQTHTNKVIEAANVRAQDEQQMQNMLQHTQRVCMIYNSDIEPEHDTQKTSCSCEVHQYMYKKMKRLKVQEMWSKAVMYPGERAYHDCFSVTVFSGNPYSTVISPYGLNPWEFQRPNPTYYSKAVQQTIQLNTTLNAKAQAAVNDMEPKYNIWETDEPDAPAADDAQPAAASEPPKASKLAGLKKALSMRASEGRSILRTEKSNLRHRDLCAEILSEEAGRWPDAGWREIVSTYQAKVGMTEKIAELRAKRPLQYLHLLRAGYFEPIPVSWANRVSNPLKFRVDAQAGWRGITPAWRGYEDTAEERLYWVLNHRAGNTGTRLKPDFISALDLARARMESAVEPPPDYFSADDACHVLHTSEGYSRQVMPAPFRAVDMPEDATDNTMILLDVSGSMDFQPMRPTYDKYLITGWEKSTQPKNKELAKSIIRRFTDAMTNHDNNAIGYQLVTFASTASYIGYINHYNFPSTWDSIKVGGGTRVMTGWQKAKELHFQRHHESATYHPVYGWQAGPRTPMLRLLLLLDGEATDMDEFELELLGLSWVHVTIFLIGVDGCPHHHRHANELQRISEVNPHVSFVDAQGNTPERFVTHELLKRHLGYDVSMSEFEALERRVSAQPPGYTE